MKAAIAAGVFVFVVLVVVTTFVPSDRARQEALADHFTQEQIADGWRYALERKLLYWASAAVTLAFLTALACTGAGRRLADVCGRLARGRWLVAVLLTGAFLFAAQVVLALVVGLASLQLRRSWDRTRQPTGDWLADFAKGQAVAAVLGIVLLVGFYLLLRYFPRTWWLLATAGGAALSLVFALLMPVLIDPLFFDFEPPADPAVQKVVQDLTQRTGVPSDAVLVSNASRRGSDTNAYYTGLGPTRRIVLYDTLVKNHTPAEVESVLAHEIGHWQHHHIIKGIALATAGSLVGLFLLALLLRWAVGRRPLRLTSPDDPAGLPLVLLFAALVEWAALPMQNAVSRTFERQADAASLELAGQPQIFIAAEKKLAKDNQANLTPNAVSVWLFSTHPTVLERIRHARQWEELHPAAK
jgi:STE24 endopeptidase